MFIRFLVTLTVTAGLVVAVGRATVVPAQAPAVTRSSPPAAKETNHDRVTLPAERIAAAKIEVARVGAGVLAHRLTVPGTITPDSNRVARIAAKVIGTATELRKQLGDPVAKGEVVAVLDSREVAEAKSEYISARVNADLQKTLFEREQRLAQTKIIAEIQFLRTSNVYTEARLRLSLARQKLIALGLDDKEIAGLPREIGGLQRYELRSPLAGRVTERLVDLGAPVGREGQANELYVIVDLSSVWVDLAVPLAELASIKEGASVSISHGADSKAAEGRIVFTSPMLNPDTRSARVIAAVDNRTLGWRPGSYITARVLVERQPVALSVPRGALQTVEGEEVVFVRTPEGFQKRAVRLGRRDDQAVEVIAGLEAGESIAAVNSFLLKAELGKSEAEHGD